MTRENYLYIFLHIPKTAGSTFVYHLKKNFKEDELLHLHFENKNFDFKKLNKSKIKVIYGHGVKYGVHKHFKREARYICFLRDPVSRAVSIYNHKRRLFNDFSKLDSKKKQNLEKTLLINKKVQSFEKWVEKKLDTRAKNTHMSVHRLLINLGYLDKPVSKKNISNFIKKFYFVGLTENYDSDSLYIYNLLNINKYFLNKNVAKTNCAPKLNKKLVNLILLKSKSDLKIYEQVLSNTKHKQVSRLAKLKRNVLLPFTQVVFAPKDTLKRILKYN